MIWDVVVVAAIVVAAAVVGWWLMWWAHRTIRARVRYEARNPERRAKKVLMRATGKSGRQVRRWKNTHFRMKRPAVHDASE